MANDKNKNSKESKTTIPALSEETVMDRIKDENRLKDTNVQAALERIKKEKDEKQIAEAQNMIMCAEYNAEKEHLTLRARRREAKITKDILQKNDEVLQEALDGKITPQEYRDKKREISKERQKKFDESADQFDKEMRELRGSYTGQYAYRSDWDW